jgi:signal transduction histidine kinase/CheY-like chemotaxis protein
MLRARKVLGIWRRLNLKGRLTGIIIAVVTTVITITSSYFITLQREEMRAQMRAKSQTMRAELGKRGLALAKNVALASERALVMNDLLFLAQIVETTQSNDDEFVYGALINAQGRVLVHTDRGLADTLLTGPEHDEAVAIETPLVRDSEYDHRPIIEVVAPISSAGRHWGIVRFGLSLEALNAEIAASEQEISARLRQSVLTSLLVAVVLTLVGVALGSAAANILARPLALLMAGVQQIQQGRLDHTVIVEGTPEFEDLARAFNDMTLAVRRREGALESALHAAGEANRLKTEFLANISHELRTPLNAILNIPAALLQDFETVLVWKCPGCQSTFDPDADKPVIQGVTFESCPDCGTPMNFKELTYFNGSAHEHKNFNQRALHSGRHLLQVVNDILDFSKLQAAKMELKAETWEITDLVRSACDTVRGLAEAKHLTFTVELPQQGITLHADRVRLEQVLINLLGNAIKFTGERGSVSLSVAESYSGDTSLVHIVVRDTGVGIPNDKLQIIFEPFRQADGGHTRAHGGSGLGLTITAQLVEMHGGRVWAESELGRGSVFHVVLPKVPVGGVLEAPQATAAPAVGRVVVVDDDDFYLQVGVKMLRSAGYEVEVISASERACERITETRPDFVILDIMMPEQNGLDVLRHLKAQEETHEIPVLIASGFHNNEVIVRQLGGLWLPKPWAFQDLTAVLAQAEHLRKAKTKVVAQGGNA